MATCPACDSELDLDESGIEKGDAVVCDDCGSNLVVDGVTPLTLLEDTEDEDEDEFGEDFEDDDDDDDDFEDDDDDDDDE